MNTNIEKLEDSKVKIDITVEAEKFEEALENTFKKNAHYFSVPGFRKGKAPRKIVEKYYGGNVLFEETFNQLIPDIYEKAIKENNLDVVVTPSVDITQIGSGKDLKCTITVTVKPEVKLGKYKGISLNQKEYPVTDELVTEHLQEMAEKNARIVTADKRRKLKAGDTAVIDFEGFVDDVPFDGGKAEGYSLEIGSGKFIPGFEDQLIGMKYDEEKEIKVPFPEDYFSKDLAGKEATFKVKLHEIKVKELPEIDDEFAKDVSEFDTLEDLKQDVREHIEDENAAKAKFETEEEALKQVMDATELKIPSAMVEAEIDNYVKDISHRLSHQGLNLEAYLQMIGKTTEQMRDEYKEQAEKNIRTRLVLEAIFEKEQLEVTEEDMNAKLTEFAKAYGKDATEFVKNANEDTKNYVKEELKYDLAVKFIIANAKIEKNK